MDFVEGRPLGVPRRGITAASAKRWCLTHGEYEGGKVLAASYLSPSGEVVGQRLRTADKKFIALGDCSGLYGQWLWRGCAKARVVVTKGEFDAVSLDQALIGGTPVVSGSVRVIAAHLPWLCEFNEVVLAGFTQFDAVQIAKMLPPGKAKVVEIAKEDPSAMLSAGLTTELQDAVRQARAFKPQGLVRVRDVKKKALTPKKIVNPWFDPRLTKITYGRQPGSLIFIGAAVAAGKTDFLLQSIAYDVTELKEQVGVLFLETQADDIVTRVAGKIAGKRFHIPEGDWSPQELEAELDKLDEADRIHMLDEFGMGDWDEIETTIRFLHHAEGVKLFYVDHLTALASGRNDERVELERITARMGMLVKELPIVLVVVSHLATPEYGSHEDASAPIRPRDFKGSRSIAQWATGMFGIERNQTAEDPEQRLLSILIVLKDRLAGDATGTRLPYRYNRNTGRLDSHDAAPPARSKPKRPSHVREDEYGVIPF